jgi:hypothetical protein
MLRGLLAFALIASTQFGQLQTRDNPASTTATSTIRGRDWLQVDELAGGWQDPALLDSIARAATRLTLTENQKLPVSLKLIAR